MSADRGRDTSAELVEVRTVLGRAVNARETLIKWRDRVYVHSGGWDPAACKWDLTEYPPDVDVDAMIAALDDTIAALSRWRRTGRPAKVTR